MDKLFIPKKLKVGYQKRSDTYTNMLAYVIYYDEKGVLRKEKGWEGWRDKNIDPNHFDNIPTEGFVLNKDVGGGRRSWSWDSREAKCRVWDPRNFEFEITFENLLFILKECTSSKGKGLEGEFVYAWQGTDLVLLPAGCEDYKKSMEYTALQDKKISKKELVEGVMYLTKQDEKVMYLGKYLYKEYSKIREGFVFYFTTGYKRFDVKSDVKHIAGAIDETPSPDFAETLTKFNNSEYSVVVESYTTSKISFNHENYMSSDRKYHHGSRYDYNSIDEITYKAISGGSVYKYESDGVYRVYTVREAWELEPPKKYIHNGTEYLSHSRLRSFKGIVLSSTKAVVFDGDTFKIKDMKTIKDEIIYTVDDVNRMGFVSINLKRPGKKSFELCV